jgi:hypothetical protein
MKMWIEEQARSHSSINIFTTRSDFRQIENLNIEPGTMITIDCYISSEPVRNNMSKFCAV